MLPLWLSHFFDTYFTVVEPSSRLLLTSSKFAWNLQRHPETICFGNFSGNVTKEQLFSIFWGRVSCMSMSGIIFPTPSLEKIGHDFDCGLVAHQRTLSPRVITVIYSHNCIVYHSIHGGKYTPVSFARTSVVNRNLTEKKTPPPITPWPQQDLTPWWVLHVPPPQRKIWRWPSDLQRRAANRWQNKLQSDAATCPLGRHQVILEEIWRNLELGNPKTNIFEGPIDIPRKWL